MHIAKLTLCAERSDISIMLALFAKMLETIVSLQLRQLAMQKERQGSEDRIYKYVRVCLHGRSI